MKKIINRIAFYLRYFLISNSKQIGPVKFNEDTEKRILEGFESFGIKITPLKIDLKKYNLYFKAAGYDKLPDYYRTNIKEKSLEHFLAAELLNLNNEDIYIDIASEKSPVPLIYEQLFGCKTYKQDLSYPVGLNGDEIGGNAAHMPIPDNFASKMALHCSFEHFEEEADIDFIKELSRVLKKGGKCCIVPLYIFDKYVIQTDPGASNKLQFEYESTVFCAKDWGNRHGRFYDPAHLKMRVINNLSPDTRFTLYQIINAKDLDKSCYAKFALLLEKK